MNIPIKLTTRETDALKRTIASDLSRSEDTLDISELIRGSSECDNDDSQEDSPEI